MAILPKERPDKSKKEKLENLEIASPFLEKNLLLGLKKNLIDSIDLNCLNIW